MSLASSDEDEEAVPIKTVRKGSTQVSSRKRMAGRKRKTVQLGSDSEGSSGSDELEDLLQGSDSGAEDGDSDCSDGGDSDAECSDGGDSEEDMGVVESRPFEVTSWKKAIKVRKSGAWAGGGVCTPVGCLG